jgi:hypothetical protein
MAATTPAARATVRDEPESRAIAHVSGAASEPMRTPGIALATAVGPRIEMNGAWSRLASGSQWAFEGIGSVGIAGMRAPTSAKIQMKSTLRPLPAAMDRATST